MKTKLYRNAYIWLAALALAVACQPILAADFHVATAQGLQNALTTAAHNGMDNNIYLTNGYYEGNFNYNSSEANNLTLLAEPGLTNTGITIDGEGVGNGLTISSSVSNNTITVQGLGFAINCGPLNGSYNVGALIIRAGSQATVSVNGCHFFSPPEGHGNGLLILSGANVTINGCTAVGASPDSGDGGWGVAVGDLDGLDTNFQPNVTVQNCAFLTNASGLFVGTRGNFVVVSSNIFNGNLEQGLDLGGGLVLSGYGIASTGTASLVSQNIFSGNQGLAVGIANCTSANLTGNTFTTNFGITGGGAFLCAESTTVSGSTFIGNVGTEYGSGSGPAFSAGGALAVSDYAATTVTNLMITSNVFIGN
jgi:hypothetical protein